LVKEAAKLLQLRMRLSLALFDNPVGCLTVLRFPALKTVLFNGICSETEVSDSLL
jgi:hypothetical protein